MCAGPVGLLAWSDGKLFGWPAIIAPPTIVNDSSHGRSSSIVGLTVYVTCKSPQQAGLALQFIEP